MPAAKARQTTRTGTPTPRSTGRPDVGHLEHSVGGEHGVCRAAGGNPPLLDFYRATLVPVDAVGTVEDITDRILAAVRTLHATESR